MNVSCLETHAHLSVISDEDDKRSSTSFAGNIVHALTHGGEPASLPKVGVPSEAVLEGRTR